MREGLGLGRWVWPVSRDAGIISWELPVKGVAGVLPAGLFSVDVRVEGCGTTTAPQYQAVALQLRRSNVLLAETEWRP